MMIYISLVAIVFFTDCVEWYFLPKTEIKVFLKKKWIYVVLVGDHQYISCSKHKFLVSICLH